MKVNDTLIKRYTTNVIPKKSRPGCWDILKVEIFDNGKKIGQYERSYPTLFNTFHPFEQHGKHYALYSADYTTTRIMELPSCKDIGGEKRNSPGFCPVDYAVLHDPEMYKEWAKCYGPGTQWDNPVYMQRFKALINGEIGFVAGCVWGDDSSWKIQFLNLKKMKEGFFSKGRDIREDWLGYIELPRGIKLKDAISFEEWEPDHEQFTIATPHRFLLDKKEPRKYD